MVGVTQASPEPANAPAPAHSLPGVRLHRTDENVEEIRALADLLGEPTGVDAVLDDLNRKARRSPARLLGRAVREAYTWDRADRADRVWWPQGVSTSADASDDEEIAGRRVLAITWYSKQVGGVTQGSRVTFLDLDSLRYRHVLLVVPTLDDHGDLKLKPLKVHAGGIVWYGPYLHIAATARGIMTCRADDIMRIPDERRGPRNRLGASTTAVAAFGYRYVLPLRFSYRASTDRGQHRLRYSFLSLDRASEPPQLVSGEYGRGEQTTRLARFSLDPKTSLPDHADDGFARPVLVEDTGVAGMQGVAFDGGRYYISVSHGQFMPGSVTVGHPGSFTERRLASPIGPEDIAYWASTDRLWSVTEHPCRRWIVAMDRSWFDR